MQDAEGLSALCNLGANQAGISSVKKIHLIHHKKNKNKRKNQILAFTMLLSHFSYLECKLKVCITI